MTPNQRSADRVIQWCADKFNTTPLNVVGHKRDTASSRARMVAMAVCRHLMPASRKAIAGFFNRCGSDISYAVLEAERRIDPPFNKVYAEAMKHFASMPDDPEPKRRVVLELVCGEVMVKSKPDDIEVVVERQYGTGKA